MKCALCGRNSTKPICKVCAREIAMDTPFLTRQGFACGDFESGNYDSPIILPGDLKRANELARRAMMGKSVDFLFIGELALRCHKECGKFLEIFEIENGYYLRLAEQFAKNLDTPQGKYLLARVYHAQGSGDDAIGVMEEIWRENRDYSLFYANLLMEAGKWGHAVEIYHQLLSKDPNNEKLWLLMADALMAAEQFEEADRAYLRVLQINKDNADAWYHRGLCLRKMGKWGGALQSFQTAVRKNPKMKEAYDGILEILLERNMYSRAKETLKAMQEEGFDVDEQLEELEGLMRQ